MGGGVNSWVLALTTYHGQVIAGGEFSAAGGVAASHVALWNGSSWQPMGDGLNDDVLALAVFKDEVIAAGRFTSSGSVPLDQVARWTGTEWQPLGQAIGNCGNNNNSWFPRALTVYAGELVIAPVFGMGCLDCGRAAPGYSTTCNDAMGIARWDGGRWKGFGVGLGYPTDGTIEDRDLDYYESSTVSAMLVWGGRLVVGGGLYYAGDVTAHAIATWTWD